MTKCHLRKIRFQGTGLRWREATCWPESSCPPAPEGRGCLCSKETAHDLRPTHLVARSGEVQGRKLSPEIEADFELNSPAHFQSNNYLQGKFHCNSVGRPWHWRRWWRGGPMRLESWQGCKRDPGPVLRIVCVELLNVVFPLGVKHVR